MIESIIDGMILSKNKCYFYSLLKFFLTTVRMSGMIGYIEKKDLEKLIKEIHKLYEYICTMETEKMDCSFSSIKLVFEYILGSIFSCLPNDIYNKQAKILLCKLIPQVSKSIDEKSYVERGGGHMLGSNTEPVSHN